MRNAVISNFNPYFCHQSADNSGIYCVRMYGMYCDLVSVLSTSVKRNFSESIRFISRFSALHRFISYKIIKMLRQVIPRVVQNIRTIEKRQLCAASIENTKLEKTINQVTLLGRVGGDAQKRGNEDHPVVIFSLATHSNYRYMNGDFVQRTEWHRICIFKPALRDTVLNYLKKGQRVYVLGKINYGEFKDEEGVVKPSTSVIADDVIFFQS